MTNEDEVPFYITVHLRDFASCSIYTPEQCVSLYNVERREIYTSFRAQI
jgi:hypothetical protein